jgi:ubiquitin carboxyl-terminal hydrolase 22/27/51
MLPYTNRARGQETKDNYELARSCTYDLLSVIVHVGEIDTGHYVSYCRVGDQVSVPPTTSPLVTFDANK